MKLIATVLVYVGISCCSSAVADEAQADWQFVPTTSEPVDYLPLPRIVGGRYAVAGQFPYIVSVRVRGAHTCGGAIINRVNVLTAGHCVAERQSGLLVKTPVSRLSIYAGSTYIYAGGIAIGVDRVRLHARFGNFANDIAVLRLSTTFIYSNVIQPIALARADPPASASVVIAGWGRVRTGGEISPTLQYVNVTAITNAQCSQRIGAVPNSVLCLNHSSGIGACQGDSGGPAVYNNRLVGLTSFTVGGCGTNAPDGYAKISLLRTWIIRTADRV